MPLEDWDPFQELNRLRKRFDELFERGFRSGLAGEAIEEHWTPPVDVMEGNDLMLVFVEIPGIVQSDIDLQFADGRLVIQGERMPSSGAEASFHRMERRHGPFRRVLDLGGHIDVAGLKALYELEVSLVELPMQGKSGNRKIEVT